MNPISPPSCRTCGTPLGFTAAGHLCPACLLQAAQHSGTVQGHLSDTLLDPSSPVPDLRAGAQIRYFGDYEILDELARGGMGVVYRARQVSLNRPVAVKMILSGQLASERDVRRFLLEAEAVANLQHPHIVAIHEVGQHSGLHYFSMDLVDGEDLAQTLRRGPMDPRAAATLIRKISSAVAYAHRHSILHRDLKPSNILIGSDGEPRVTDFGLAKRQETTAGLTVSGAILGTPAYMAPEQAEGRLEEIDRRTDVFGLGAVLYEMLAGRAPFNGENPMAVLKQVIEKDPEPPNRFNPTVPRDLEAICLKCLQKNAANRYQTASELAEDLDRFLRHEPVLARPPAKVLAYMDWIRRNQQAVVIALSLLGLAFCVGMFTFWDYSRFLLWKANHPDAPSPAPTYFEFVGLKGYDGHAPTVLLFGYLLLAPAGLLAVFAARKTSGTLRPGSLVRFTAIALVNLAIALAASLRAAHCIVWTTGVKLEILYLCLPALAGAYFTLQLIALVAREMKVWRFGERNDEARLIYGGENKPTSLAPGFRRAQAETVYIGFIALFGTVMSTNPGVALLAPGVIIWGGATAALIIHRKRLLAAIRGPKVPRQVLILVSMLAVPVYFGMSPVTGGPLLAKALGTPTPGGLATGWTMSVAFALLGAWGTVRMLKHANDPVESSLFDASSLRAWEQKQWKGPAIEPLTNQLVFFAGFVIQPMAAIGARVAAGTPRWLAEFAVADNSARFRRMFTALLCFVLVGLSFLSVPYELWTAVVAVSFLAGAIVSTAHTFTLPPSQTARRTAMTLSLVSLAVASVLIAMFWPEIRALPARQLPSFKISHLSTDLEIRAVHPFPERIWALRDLYAEVKLYKDGIRHFNRLASKPDATPTDEFERRWAAASLMAASGQVEQAQAVCRDLTERFQLVHARHLRLSPSFTNENNRGYSTSYPPESPENATTAWVSPHPDALEFPGYLNLERHFQALGESTSNRVVYARLLIVAPQDTPIRLTTGSDDDLAAWFNGERVVRKNFTRRVALDSDVLHTHLRRGTNVLLAKICNRTNDWGLLIRITDRNLRPIPGLTFPETNPANPL